MLPRRGVLCQAGIAVTILAAAAVATRPELTITTAAILNASVSFVILLDTSCPRIPANLVLLFFILLRFLFLFSSLLLLLLLLLLLVVLRPQLLSFAPLALLTGIAL